MINLAKKIQIYLGRKPDFLNEVILRDDMIDGISNPYIEKWNITSEKAKPTDEELNALSSQAETLVKNNMAVANRKAEYGSVETQLEFLVENGVDAFIARQNEIKNKYPKENE